MISKIYIFLSFKMKNKTTYLFHCSNATIGIDSTHFFSIEKKYGNLVWLIQCKQQQGYVIGFSTNVKTIHKLSFTVWNAIVEDVKTIIRKYNFETYGMKNTQKHVRIDVPSKVN